MSDNPPTGLHLASFDAVEELVARVLEDPLSSQDRELNGSHSLVVLVEGTLEAISVAHLGLHLAGLNKTTMEALTAERRRLEDSGTRPALQRLLFAFEGVCDAVRDSLYSAASDAVLATFFDFAFPQWLVALESWAEEEGFDELRSRVVSARNSYHSLPPRWWDQE